MLIIMLYNYMYLYLFIIDLFVFYIAEYLHDISSVHCFGATCWLMLELLQIVTVNNRDAVYIIPTCFLRGIEM